MRSEFSYSPKTRRLNVIRIAACFCLLRWVTERMRNLSVTDPAMRQIDYTYDHENRFDIITDPVAGLIDQDYDALGRPDTRSFPNAMIADYGFDIRNRISILEHKANGRSVLSNRVYSYDSVSNVTDIAGTEAKHYDYDDLYRLTNAVAEGESFTYDPVGNRLTYKSGTTWTFNENNQLKTAEGVNLYL